MGVYSSAIVGLKYQSGRAANAARLSVGQKVDLRREPENEHDPDAVAVYANGNMLGYIPARHAYWAAGILDRNGHVRAYVARIVTSGIIFRIAESVDLEIRTGADSELGFNAPRDLEREDEDSYYGVSWRATKRGLRVLRWLGVVGGNSPEQQRHVMDSYIYARAADFRIPMTGSLSTRLRDAVMENSGARSVAMTAAREMASDDNDIDALAPCVTAMVKADGAFTVEEAQAVQDLLKTLRRKRDKDSRE